MTNYHVYADELTAQAAADDMSAKYVPRVEETDLAGNPAEHPQVTSAWDVPRQRNDGQWVIQEYPGYVPTPAPVATEPYDPDWFARPPINIVPPSLSYTTAWIGLAVSCISGEWLSAPTFKYQWQADGEDILQAITSVHTVTLADVGKVLTCVVTATNEFGSTDAVSNECVVN
jgi:hypothetical protein